MLRKENFEKAEDGMAISFRRLSFGNYLDVDVCSIQSCQIFSDYGWMAYYERCRQLTEQLDDDKLYDYTNGHDICKILGMICKDEKGEMGEKRVRDTLYMMYNRENFVRTNLYNSLKQYQNNRTWEYVH